MIVGRATTVLAIASMIVEATLAIAVVAAWAACVWALGSHSISPKRNVLLTQHGLEKTKLRPYAASELPLKEPNGE